MKNLKTALALALLVMCVSASSARANEHVNLWPIYMYESGTHDIIWPLGNYKSSNSWRFFPIVRKSSSFYIFPEFWFNSDSFAVLPFYARYDFSEGILFPVVGWEKTESKTIHTLFPLYWYSNRPNDGEFTFWAACGMGGYAERDGKMRAHWAFPLYTAWDDGDFFSIPYSKSAHYGGTDEAYFCGLFGRTVATNGNTTAHWFFPVYGKTEREFISLPYCEERHASGRTEWLSLPLLSGGESGPEASKAKYLLALAGYERKSDAFESWCAPLYYANKDSFASLPYAHSRNESEESDTYVILPLLSGCTKYDDGRLDTSALILYGHGSDEHGKTRHDYLFPLYHYDGVKDNFTSLVYGRHSCGNSTNHWWATPLVGTRTGSKTGGWFFPFFNRTKDASYDDDLARLDAPTISEEDCTPVWSRVRGSVLIGSDHDRTVSGSIEAGDSKTYRLSATSKQGNRLLFNRNTERTVKYDIASRQKTEERASSETMVLGGLFTDERRQNQTYGSSYARTRVLWKLWDREERNGHVTVDAFPGFTYESKTNGYSNTSFLWRFYRYERKANGEKNLDLLFVPILRGRK